jgi:hypothetical protein
MICAHIIFLLINTIYIYLDVLTLAVKSITGTQYFIIGA